MEKKNIHWLYGSVKDLGCKALAAGQCFSILTNAGLDPTERSVQY